MDRDMVNCLHYLYQWGEITPQQLAQDGDPKNRIFWCDQDTRYPLQGRRIVAERKNGALRTAPGVYDLLDMIEDQLRSLPRPDFALGYPLSAPIRARGERRPAFLAISYARRFNPIKQAVLEAATAAGFDCEVTGDLQTPGPIMDQVWQGIRGADAVIAEITGNNPNVFYEIGLAHALGKEVILLSQKPDSPFDIRASRRLTYDPRELTKLQRTLKAALKAISARYPHEGREPRF